MEPSPEEVRAQLERLLASEALATSSRLRRFLSFIVERTLDGEGQKLKEYAVGIEVFDRDDQYNPRIDSIVRVEAGRLRARLDEYLQSGGSGRRSHRPYSAWWLRARVRTEAHCVGARLDVERVGRPRARAGQSRWKVVGRAGCHRDIGGVAGHRGVVATHRVGGREHGFGCARRGVAVCALFN